MHATRTLMDEHQTILRTLAALEKLVSDDAHADEPSGTFREVVDFLRTYADRLHHGKEEALLFPAMEARGMPADAGPTAAMRHEHDQGRLLVGRMADLADAEPFDRQAFAGPALEFVALLRAHIGKEDHILFPMADRMLAESDLDQLGRAYQEAEDRDFDVDVHERYENWARALARRVGVDRDRFDAQPACHA